MAKPRKGSQPETYPSWKEAALILGIVLGNRSFCPPGRSSKTCEAAFCRECWVDWAFEEAKKEKKSC